MSYFACPPAAWEAAAEHLPRPWLPEWAVADLRYWVDWIGGGVRRGLPTEAALCERWGWGNRRVRALLHDLDAWVDPAHIGDSQRAVLMCRHRAPVWKGVHQKPAACS